MQTIADRLTNAREAIALATANAHRPAHSVQLLAVSKTKPVSDIVQAYEAGQRKFGENYVQEGVDKIQQLNSLPDIEWHMIGPIQSNKTRIVAEHFNWVQSVDREKTVRRLSEQRPSALPPLNVCIQVNIDDESSKSGVAPDDMVELADAIMGFDNIVFRGVMAIPSPTASSQQQQSSLETLNSLYMQLKQQYTTVDTLSVGMSGDMQMAIEHGSTMVRIGTAIFGARN